MHSVPEASISSVAGSRCRGGGYAGAVGLRGGLSSLLSGDLLGLRFFGDWVGPSMAMTSHSSNLTLLKQTWHSRL